MGNVLGIADRLSVLHTRKNIKKTYVERRLPSCHTLRYNPAEGESAGQKREWCGPGRLCRDVQFMRRYSCVFSVITRATSRKKKNGLACSRGLLLPAGEVAFGKAGPFTGGVGAALVCMAFYRPISYRGNFNRTSVTVENKKKRCAL